MDIIAPIPITTDAQLISSSIPETERDEYAAGTTYAVDAYVQVTADGVHKIYRSAVAANIGHYPPDNIYDDTVTPATGYWIDVGSTNRWAMFDGRSRAASSAEHTIIVEIAPGQVFNAIALPNIEAANIFITITDPTLGVLYDKVISTADLTGISDFYSWFFYPIVRLQTIILLDIPGTPSATIRLSIAAAEEIAVCGELIAGTLRHVGKLQYGYSVSIRDYSTKEKDDNGNATVVEGVYSDTGSFKVVVDSSRVYDIKRMLGGYRATPLVWIGADWRQDSIIYGYYTDFDVSIEALKKSYCTIEVEELS